MKRNFLLTFVLFAMVFSASLFVSGEVPATKSSFEIEAWAGVWTIKPVLKMANKEKPWEGDSEQNYGVSLRFKPRKTFSLGLSWQRAKGRYFYSVEEVIEGARLVYDWNTGKNRALDQYIEEKETVDISSQVILLDFRWDMIPKGRIHPYFTFGLGAAMLDITSDYLFSDRYIDPQDSSYESTFDLERTHGGLFDFNTSVVPVLELMFGLKAELLKKKLCIGIEGGFVDGIVYRGVVNFRF